ncbi:hypothetical protein [Herbidospora sp. RD11066]
MSEQPHYPPQQQYPTGFHPQQPTGPHPAYGQQPPMAYGAPAAMPYPVAQYAPQPYPQQPVYVQPVYVQQPAPHAMPIYPRMSVTAPRWTVGEIFFVLITGGLAWPFIYLSHRGRKTVTRHY